MKIVGFHSGHDVSYCILENGIPVLHEELERISRKKMELGDGLKFFFSRCNNFDDLKHFTFGNWKARTIDSRRRTFRDQASEDQMNKILSQNKGRFYEFGHHLSHAASAYYTSDFDEALIIVMDAGGWEEDGTRPCFTIRKGIGNKIETVKVFPSSEIDLGGLWYKSTKYIFGLSVGYPHGDQAGTVMAMATLGKPIYANLFAGYNRNLQKLRTIAEKSEQEKFNVAASLQEYTEKLFHKAVSKYIPGQTNLCFSGGVSLNCVLLGKIKKWFPEIRNIFCDPVPYDAGVALGSARYLWHHVLGNPRVKDKVNNRSPYLGRIYSKKDIEEAFKLFADKIKVSESRDEDVLNKIYRQKIVSVFGGGSESGRRALGNRSILADPGNEEMKAKINEKVKHREWFRPFAPSILEEKVDDWFEDHYQSPYMSFAVKFKEGVRDRVPAVVHLDGTARLQTVSKALNPWFHNFLVRWEQISGVPILLNTSFNDSEPIIETPEDALTCFLRTEIDYLYFFDYGYLVEKV